MTVVLWASPNVVSIDKLNTWAVKCIFSQIKYARIQIHDDSI